MFIHFIGDSIYTANFIKYIEDNFDFNKHVFIVLTNKKTKYVPKFQNVYILKMKKNLSIFKTLYLLKYYLSKLKPKHVFLHSLSTEHLIPIFFISKNVKLFWIVWGGDLYTNIKYKLYDDKTKNLINYSCKKKSIKQKILLLLRQYLVKRIDFIAINNIEFDIIKNNYNIKAKRVDFIYPNSTHSSQSNNHDNIKTILLGNSGDPSNNHISILEKLANLPSKFKFKVIVPLCYGENKNYIAKIEQKGLELLGDRFFPLFNFMDLKDYAKLLSSVDIAIMNHFRQQALGNLRILLALGKKVYLNETNPLYKYFQNENVYISCIDECNFDEYFFDEYTDEVKLKNKTNVERIFSQENIYNYMKNLFNQIQS